MTAQAQLEQQVRDVWAAAPLKRANDEGKETLLLDKILSLQSEKAQLDERARAAEEATAELQVSNDTMTSVG